MIVLTDEERTKFRLWLIQSADSDEVLLTQMEAAGMIPELVKRRKIDVVCQRHVAHLLDTETCSISGS